MNARQAKKLRKEARRMADREQARLIPEFKTFVNTQLSLGERFVLAWRIVWKRF